MVNIYVQKGLISEEEYQRAVAYQQKARISFPDSLIKLSILKEDKVVRYCKSILGA